jgi:drug/metabolite transporter (DMT)-like permease
MLEGHRHYDKIRPLRGIRTPWARTSTVSRRGWALFAAVGVIWGIPYLLIKVADGGVSVSVLVFTRVLLGSLLLLPAAVRRGRLRALLPCWPWVVALSVVEVIVPWLLLSAAERQLSSSLSGLLVAVVPILASAWPGWPVTATG